METGRSGTHRGDPGSPASVSALALSANGRQLFSGAGSGDTIKIWDTATHKELLTLRSTFKTRMIIPAHDGKRLFSTSDDGVKLWDLGTGKELLSIRGQHTGGIQSLALSSDGQRLFFGYASGTIEAVDLAVSSEQ